MGVSGVGMGRDSTVEALAADVIEILDDDNGGVWSVMMILGSADGRDRFRIVVLGLGSYFRMSGC